MTHPRNVIMNVFRNGLVYGLASRADDNDDSAI